MYVQVTVAVMLHQFVLLVERARLSQDSKELAIAKSAATCGQKLLLELLNAAVEENLIPLLQDHNIKMQALSCSVLIATNVLLCTSPPSQQNLLELVLPAILPYMTTHHHNLRRFAQTVDDLPFECAPVAIVDQIALFLNEAREGIREAMAKDAVTLNAKLSASHNEKSSEKHGHIPAIPDLDDQLLLSTPPLSAVMPMLLMMTSQGAIDAEEELLLASKESRLKELGHVQGGQQELIVVASLIDRIPNLAGLACTCEVFKNASLVVADASIVVADASIVEDRQFQLIRLPLS
ncbi:unnamed protein product [Sphagnum balticum]